MNVEELVKRRTNEIDVDKEYLFDTDFLKDSPIRKLDSVHIKGKLFRDTDDNNYIKVTVTGEMYIDDSISLELVKYPFSIDCEENLADFLTKDENTLDIMEFLWQNIVLEVPLRYTSVIDTSKYSGDGWKLIDEKDSLKNNPFESLLKDRSDN